MDEAFKSFFSCPKNRTLKKEEIEAREGLEAFRARLLFRFFFRPETEILRFCLEAADERGKKNETGNQLSEFLFLCLSLSPAR